MIRVFHFTFSDDGIKATLLPAGAAPGKRHKVTSTDEQVLASGGAENGKINHLCSLGVLSFAVPLGLD